MKPIEKFIQLKKEIGEVYCYVNNGGTIFIVGKSESGYPVIRVMSTHFGNIIGLLELAISKECLQKLSELFETAAKTDFESESLTEAQYYIKGKS